MEEADEMIRMLKVAHSDDRATTLRQKAFDAAMMCGAGSATELLQNADKILKWLNQE